MTLVVPVGYGQAAYRFSLTDDPEVMITTIGVDTQFGVSGPEELADKLATDFIAGWPAGAIIQGWTFLGVTIYAGDGSGGSTIYEAPRAHVGTSAGSSPPQNCAMLIRKQSQRSGRMGRGRMYLPPFGLNEAGVLNNGVFPPADLAAHQGRVNQAFLGDQFYILHDSLSAGDKTPTQITGLIVDRQLATQRRRLR